MCDHWESDASGSSNPCSVYTDGAKSVHALFAPNSPLTYSLTVNGMFLLQASQLSAMVAAGNGGTSRRPLSIFQAEPYTLYTLTPLYGTAAFGYTTWL